jgi:hypothetical protein
MKNKNTNNFRDKQQKLNLSAIENKPIELDYTGEKISTDGGLLLLKEVENQINILKDLSACIDDERDQRYIDHTIESLVKQRVYQIAGGYEDANDCNSLRNDAIIKMCSDCLPETNSDLGSQPTMSRFENSIRRTELYRIAKMFVLNFIKSYETAPPVIILDPDDTNYNAYGNQLQIEYNHYYGEYVFMPLHIYEGFSGKLITTILKPGRRSKSVNVFAVMQRIIKLLRKYWPDTIIIFRGDSHFHSPELSSYCKTDAKLKFITGLTGNSRLNKLSETTIKSAEKMFKETKKPIKLYHTFSYKADSWEYEERVIVKVEVNEKGTNIRYISTNDLEHRTKNLYEIGYCARGSAELRIKDHKTYLKSDRTSCNKFEANQMRLFLHSAAYVLIHTLQKEVLKGTKYVNSTMQTIQLKILKTAAKVKELKTKIKVEFPRTCPVAAVQTKAFNIFETLRE